MSAEAKYRKWARPGLIERITELEAQLKSLHHHKSENPSSPRKLQNETEPMAQASPGQTQNKDTTAGSTPAKKPKAKKTIDPSKYSTRYIALKLSYLGKRFGGFEYAEAANQPTIEEELWHALTRARLIFPEDDKVINFDCCEYSKCGRTDRGVSAFGQVIALRVRSNRPQPKKPAPPPEKVEEPRPDEMEQDGDAAVPEPPPWDDVKDEICYPRVLNKLLPPDIRVQAWCPSPGPDFSARFSCGERQYRYFFTQPAFLPEPGEPLNARGVQPGWLDIEAMRDAAKRFEGSHDFRNFCKVDPSKQLSEFTRQMFEVDVEEVKDVSSNIPLLRTPSMAPPGATDQEATYPKVYSLNVKGNAFLWHQIRHMVGVLFLVGQGYESPSIVSELLDTAVNPRRPAYNMAHDAPLVLWDCIFPADRNVRGPDTVGWVYVSDDSMWGIGGVMTSMWQTWRECKMDELLANQLLQYTTERTGAGRLTETRQQPNKSIKMFEGGNGGRLNGTYVPVMKKQRLDPPEDQNDRYAKRKGFASADDMRSKKGFRKQPVEDMVE